MTSDRLVFRVHAIRRMFQRGITTEDVRKVVSEGELVEDYPDDSPYPSRLILGWHGSRPIHLVVANNKGDREKIIVTVYEPDLFALGARIQEEKAMKCVVCRQTETQPGRATITLERDGVTLVVKGVPAMVCPNCGEEYVDEKTTQTLLKSAEDAAHAGVQVDIRQYVAV